MSEPGGADPLRDLGERLDQARRAQQGEPAGDRAGDMGLPRGGLALAFRIAVELVAALAVGLAIGWALDRWLGTRPWGLIIFFFFGAGAGMLNVYRAVGGSGMMGEDASERNARRPRRGQSANGDED
jgi:ATP synthase protein I